MSHELLSSYLSITVNASGVGVSLDKTKTQRLVERIKREARIEQLRAILDGYCTDGETYLRTVSRGYLPEMQSTADGIDAFNCAVRDFKEFINVTLQHLDMENSNDV